MIRIGICDDNALERAEIKYACEQYLQEKKIKYEFEIFTCGEEVLEYCNNDLNKRIDLIGRITEYSVYLDGKMKGTS